MILIGLTGKATSGKNLFARYILESASNSNVYQKSFAKPIKAITWALLGHLYPGMNANDPRMLESSQKDKELRHPRYRKYDRAARQYLQDIGKTMREVVDKDIWTDMLFTQVHLLADELAVQAVSRPDPDIYRSAMVVVTDVRYDNEAERIKKWEDGGLIVKINRDQLRKVREHESENGVSSTLIDIEIDNNGTREDLKLKAKELVQTVLGEKYVN